MMNQNISRIVVVVIAGILAFSSFSAEALVPIKNINLIDSKLDQPPLKKIKNTEEFCMKFSETSSVLEASVAKQKTKILGFLNGRKDASKEGRDARDIVSQTSREKADQRRNDWYKRLEDKANTDTEKNAVIQFKQTVDDAVDARHAAVDTTMKTFRAGVDDAIDARDIAMQGAGSTFAASVDTAIATVETFCDKGSTTGAIRANFRGNLGNAREALKNDRKNTDKVGAQVKALAETRQETVKKAIAQFQTTLKTAVVELKKAFGEE